MENRRYRRQIAIREVERPEVQSVERDIEWICECLGLADKEDELATAIFKQLLRSTRERQGVSSRELMQKSHVTQGAVVYHLNVFISNGVVIKQGRQYDEEMR